MAYAPANLSDGAVLTSTNIKERIGNYRTAVNTELLPQEKFTDGSLTKENVIRPTLINHGFGQLEFLSESGGTKIVQTNPGDFHAQKNDNITTQNGDLGPQTGGVATQGGIARMMSVQENGATPNNITDLPEIGGLSCTVRLEEECVVRVKVKLALNPVSSVTDTHIPGQRVGISGTRQRVYLLMRKPSGAYVQMGEDSSEIGYYQQAAHDMVLREIHLYGHLNVDTVNNAKGEYTFVIVGGIEKTSTNPSVIPIGNTLLGKSSMIVEWDYGKSFF